MSTPSAALTLLAFDSFRMNKVPYLLTALGMAIGTASLILVVTIGLAGKTYVIDQISGVGANMIEAYYEGGGNAGFGTSVADYLTINDMQAVRNSVSGIMAASPLLQIHDRVVLSGGLERDVVVLGISPEYRRIRNLVISSGRFFDQEDSDARSKAIAVTDTFATRQYGSPQAAVGQHVRIGGIPFTIIGTFHEQVETFGETEIEQETLLIPYSIARYLTGTDTVKQLFFSASDMESIPRVTHAIAQVIQSRHRPGSVYRVSNLTEILIMARRIANGLNCVLLLVAGVTLVVSGIGIMNVMLSNFRARIGEIGIRRAVGASRTAIRIQFFAEALLISLVGGFAGVMAGLAIPLSIRIFTDFHLPISAVSAVIAILAAAIIGLAFGTIPASRAANFSPVEALRSV